MIANVLSYISEFFTNALNVVLSFFSNLLGSLFQGLINVIKAIVKPILIYYSCIFYVIYKIGELVVTLVSVLVALGKLVYSFLQGLYNTVSSLAWTNTSTTDHGSWSGTFNQIFGAIEVFQLDKIAYVLMFMSWILTAIAATKILSGRGASDV